MSACEVLSLPHALITVSWFPAVIWIWSAVSCRLASTVKRTYGASHTSCREETSNGISVLRKDKAWDCQQIYNILYKKGIRRISSGKKKNEHQHFCNVTAEKGIIKAFGGIMWCDSRTKHWSIWDSTLGPFEEDTAELITTVDLWRRSPVALWPGICPLCPH